MAISGDRKARNFLHFKLVHLEGENRRREIARYQAVSDTGERRAIHELIKKCLIEGKSTEEILKELRSKYNNSKLSPYYEGYIEDQKRKIKINKEEEER